MSRLWNWMWGLCMVSPPLRRFVVRRWYEIFSILDRDGEVVFMNYGYAGPDGTYRIALNSADEPHRCQIQLYHHVASQVDLRERDVLEIGSGRGGGAAYVCGRLRPKHLTGLDISALAIQFCRRHYAMPGLRFVQGDAEKLEFSDESFDAVINVESSSHYGNIRKFLSEVQRVLRPGGYLLFADIREAHEIPALLEDFRCMGLALYAQEDIAPGVVKALELDEARKLDIIQRKMPRVLRGALMEFVGTHGSEKYEAFRSGKYKYLVCVLCKEPSLAQHSAVRELARQHVLV